MWNSWVRCECVMCAYNMLQGVCNSLPHMPHIMSALWEVFVHLLNFANTRRNKKKQAKNAFCILTGAKAYVCVHVCNAGLQICNSYASNIAKRSDSSILVYGILFAVVVVALVASLFNSNASVKAIVDLHALLFALTHEVLRKYNI